MDSAASPPTADEPATSSLLQLSVDPDGTGLKSRPASPQLTQSTPVQLRPAGEILSEFDPLANSVENEAREAWGDAEGHPPPSPSPSPPPEMPERPPSKDMDTATNAPPATPPPPSTLNISAFPSLSALARTFSIPTPLRPRPLSMDSAKPVPSPGTLSSFATQQESTRSSTDQGDRREADENAASAYNTANAPATSNDSTATPSAATSTDAASFDFQKFLDQMKSRSAEPVAKYLRSYVKRSCLYPHLCTGITNLAVQISEQFREEDIHDWRPGQDHK